MSSTNAFINRFAVKKLTATAAVWIIPTTILVQGIVSAPLSYAATSVTVEAQLPSQTFTVGVPEIEPVAGAAETTAVLASEITSVSAEIPSLSLDNFDAITSTPQATLDERKAAAALEAQKRQDDADRQLILTEAYKHVDKVPYVFGGATPSGWDCSGMVKWIYNRILGINVSHGATSQAHEGKKISKEEAQPGDLVVFSAQSDNPDYYYHVGIYIGNDKMIHAPRPGANTKIGSIFIQANDRIEFVKLIDLR